MKYQRAIAKKQLEIQTLNESIAPLKAGAAKLEVALIAKLSKKGTDVKVGKDHFFTSSTPGKVVILDEKKLPKWALKTTTTTKPNLTEIKKRFNEEKITTKAGWFKIEMGTILKHKLLEEEE